MILSDNDTSLGLTLQKFSFVGVAVGDTGMRDIACLRHAYCRSRVSRSHGRFIRGDPRIR